MFLVQHQFLSSHFHPILYIYKKPLLILFFVAPWSKKFYAKFMTIFHVFNSFMNEILLFIWRRMNWKQMRTILSQILQHITVVSSFVLFDWLNQKKKENFCHFKDSSGTVCIAGLMELWILGNGGEKRFCPIFYCITLFKYFILLGLWSWKRVLKL